jgi:tripartite-type tricarboxylate transporter receptor subunit TctC
MATARLALIGDIHDDKSGNMSKINRRLFLNIMAGAIVVPSSRAFADDWPSRPVKIIAPFAPGGTADIFARILADQFGAAFKQPFYVETRPGAGGMIGSLDVAKADPDGYTLVISGNASHIVAPAFSPTPLYDGLNDFTHIAYLGGTPVGLVVHPSLPVKTYAEFVDYVKKSSIPVNYTSSGVGTHGFLFGEELARTDGLNLNHIPYKGGGQAMIDLIGGQVKIASITFSSVIEQVRTGKLTALAISSEHRLPDFRDVPTFVELGHPNMVSSTWFALSGPKGLSREIVDRLNHEVAVVLQRPDVQKLLAQSAIEVKPMSPEDTTKFFEAETARWTPLARQLSAAEAKQ